jgi:D-serine deaminase-like pyridoxal phosphate-dependent protein
MDITELDTPVLLVDGEAFDRNMARMKALTQAAGIAWRPHAKAHKSPQVAEMQIAAGACGVCCAKLGEAEVMAGAGTKDILITTPVVGLSKLTRLMQVAATARTAVVVDNAQNVDEMAMVAQTMGIRPDVVIEVDVGQGRCGVPPGEAARTLAIHIRNKEWLHFRGLQGYQGSIQMTASFAERRGAAREAVAKLAATAQLIREAGIPVEVLTGGGTGTSVIDAAEGGLTELQPGGYLFMDARYREIEWDDGNRTPFEPSLTVLSSVISLPAPDRCILDMGLKAISSDGGPPAPVDMPGAVFRFAGEEHGELRWTHGRCPLGLGDQVAFMPTHCDTTVNLYDRFIVARGSTVTDVWDIAARGRVQ